MNLVHDVTLHITRFWFVLTTIGFVFLNCGAKVISSPSVPASVVQSEAADLKKRHPSPCADACYILASLVPAKISLAKTTKLDYWDAKQSSIQPACKAEPESAEDVALIINTAIEAQCHFAIKSGGHAPGTLFSNADGGITIDLVRLDQVDIASNRKSVKLGTGARWINVFTLLESENLMVLGGRVADVGVGGLTLGGGISLYSNQYGWVCDSVISYELVLPDGRIMNVTQNSDPNLYKALRGAGQANFGVVTAFTFEAFDPPSSKGIWDAARTYTWDKVEALTKLHLDYFQAPTELIKYTGGLNAFAYVADYDSWVIVDRYIHTTHSDIGTWPEVFSPFETIEPMKGTENISLSRYSDIIESLKSYDPHGERNAFATFTFKPSYTLMLSILEIFKEEIENVKDGVEQLFPAISWHLISRNTVELMRKNGGSAISMNFQPEDAPLVMMGPAWRWRNEADDEKMNGALDRFLKRSQAKAKEMQAWHPFKYMNYAHVSQNPWEGFSKEDLDWLRRLQKEVDPKGIFTRAGLNKGGFDLHQNTVVENKETKVKDEL